MPYIVIDTETTGLFTHKYPVDWPVVELRGKTMPSDERGQPRMAEFAAVLLDDDFNVELEYQQYILPRGWMNADGTPMLEMPPEAFAVHGLSMAFLMANGSPVDSALRVYTDAVKAGRAIVGFNQQHDGRQVRAELRHAGMDDLFEQTPNTCAMRSITTNYKGQVKKLNGKTGFPRLIDAAAHFGIPYAEDRRHSALEDARVTAEVAKCLRAMEKLLPAAIHYAKDHSKDTVAA